MWKNSREGGENMERVVLKMPIYVSLGGEIWIPTCLTALNWKISRYRIPAHLTWCMPGMDQKYYSLCFSFICKKKKSFLMKVETKQYSTEVKLIQITCNIYIKTKFSRFQDLWAYSKTHTVKGEKNTMSRYHWFPVWKDRGKKKFKTPPSCGV